MQRMMFLARCIGTNFVEDKVALIHTRIIVTSVNWKDACLTKLLFVVNANDLEFQIMAMRKMEYNSISYRLKWLDNYLIFFWYSIEIFSIPHIFPQRTSWMNKTIITLFARVHTTMVTALLTTNSARPFSGWNNRGDKRDTVVVARYFNDVWEIDTILMDCVDTSNTDISGNMFFNEATNIAR